ncbi:unnamed protein product [Auanema sp. JU1783]|nr:unnamed protein product [Auanema sp. JU1783]
MGLCKCPKKKVTNLFCFEHRVNVCEHCLVENHGSCVVQSYLQWLTDSDFDSNCTLCENPLNAAETVRLQCLHVFHWSCLDAWASRFPATTAPAGYYCPCCRETLFPDSNQVSRVIDQLRTYLEKTNWARAGLGLPVLPELQKAAVPFATLVSSSSKSRDEAPPSLPKPPSGGVSHQVYEPPQTNSFRTATPATALEIDDVRFTQANDEVTFTARKKYGGAGADTQPLLNSERDVDSEANKYKRRPVREWLGGLWRAKYGSAAPRGISGPKKFAVLCIFVLIVLLTVYTLLSRSGVSSEYDPLLDPMANPNIRVASDDLLSNHL